MDFKTMEYMGSRVDEGRKILQTIKSLNEKKARLENDSFANLTFRGRSDVYIELSSAVFTEIRVASIEIIEKHIQKLESKFDEL